MDKRIATADGPGGATDITVATFDVHYRRYLDPKGTADRRGAAFREGSRGHAVALSRHDADAHLRRQGGGASAHRPDRHLSLLPRPGGGRRRLCQRDDRQGRDVHDLSRAGGATLARRHAHRAAAILGRRRARLRLCRSARGFSGMRCPSALRRRMRSAPPQLSSCAANRALRSVRLATAPRRRAISTNRSISPASGNFPPSSS